MVASVEQYLLSRIIICKVLRFVEISFRKFMIGPWYSFYAMMMLLVMRIVPLMLRS